MGWVLTEQPPQGPRRLRGITFALYRSASRAGRIRVALGSEIERQLGWLPGRRIGIWRGDGEQAGQLRLAPSNIGNVLTRPNGDAGQLELQFSPRRIGVTAPGGPARTVVYRVEDGAVILYLPSYAALPTPNHRAAGLEARAV